MPELASALWSLTEHGEISTMEISSQSLVHEFPSPEKEKGSLL
jgi:hypothetical protein